jgi:class 3 adenylate cyclase
MQRQQPEAAISGLESQRELLRDDGALGQFATIVEQHGGKVLRYAGDSVLAVFGADEAREEDDPERRLR